MKRTEQTRTVVTLTTPMTRPEGFVVKQKSDDGTIHRAFMAYAIQSVWPENGAKLTGWWGDARDESEIVIEVALEELPAHIRAELLPTPEADSDGR